MQVLICQACENAQFSYSKEPCRETFAQSIIACLKDKYTADQDLNVLYHADSSF